MSCMLAVWQEIKFLCIKTLKTEIANDYSMVHWTVMEDQDSKVQLDLGSIHIINFLYSRKRNFSSIVLIFCKLNEMEWVSLAAGTEQPCSTPELLMLGSCTPRPQRE